MTKEAEKRLVTIARYYNWYSHKYKDVRYVYCLSCKKRIGECPHCKEPLLQPKSNRVTDYALAPIYTWIECKNSDNTGRWNWADDIGPEGKRKLQRDWLEQSSAGGWLLIELGDKPAPNGKSAYLVPWGKWKAIEQVLNDNEMKSIRKETKGNRPGGDELLHDYKLEWETNTGWLIPKGHIWWKALRGKLMAEMSKIEEML